MVDHRPNPETILHRTQEEERAARRGKLKIYLGAAPGVGKTHEMLHDAMDKRVKGLDVVAGVVESHGRENIETMLEDLDVLPRKQVPYHTKILAEFDLDAALKRSPGLILVDEMAHTNAPGLRHAKRWQDIQELLDRGIDVYTTLNVQHIESLNDSVAQITHVRVQETVPDVMIEAADTIELVDLPPEELLKRLQEGKVYIPDQAALATEHFFRKGNLIALRELALRAVADRVGTDVLLYRQGEGIKQIWPTRDHVLVCVGSNPESLKLIRAAKRMVHSLQAKWVAVYVDVPWLESIPDERNNAIQNLRLAEQLGAETHVLTGFDIVKEVMQFAHEQNVTQIMIWKRTINRWLDWFQRRLSDEIVRHSGEIDVFIMTGESSETVPKKRKKIPSTIPWKEYALSIATVSFLTLLNTLLYPFFEISNLIMVYCLGIIVIALQGKTGPSILISVLSVLACDFFFIPPFYSFAVTDIQYTFTLLVILLGSQIITHLTIVTRRQAESAHLNQQQTTALYTLSRLLTGARGVDQLLALSTEYLAHVFNSEVIALLPKGQQLIIRSSYPIKKGVNAKEHSIAQWVYDMGQPAGFSTDTLTFSQALYLPIIATQESIGVFRILPRSQQLFTPDQMGLLDSCINQVALALEVDRLHEKSRKKAFQLEAERTSHRLLQSISTDLLHPVNTVLHSINTLKAIGGENINQLENDINCEAYRLNRLSHNILLIIQLESEPIVIEKKRSSLKKMLNLALTLSAPSLKNRAVHMNLSKNTPLVYFNKKLIQDVLINLIDTTVKSTPLDAALWISMHVEQQMILTNIGNSDPDRPLSEKSDWLEKFDKNNQLMDKHGLSLTVCQKIVAAHGGRMWVNHKKNQGAAFRFTLPL